MDENARPVTWFERRGYGSGREEVQLVSVLLLIGATMYLILNQQLDPGFSMTDPLGVDKLTNTQGVLALIGLISLAFSSLIVIISSVYSTGFFDRNGSSGLGLSALLFTIILLVLPIIWIYGYYWLTFGTLRGEDGRISPQETLVNLGFLAATVIFLVYGLGL